MPIKYMWQPSLGNYSLPITHSVRGTQRLFDEGISLVFNFNQDEAQARFNATVVSEPESCAMCWWGVAYSHAPFLNHPYGRIPEDALAGVAAAKRAARVAASSSKNLSAKEHGLIAAMATRFPPTVGGNWTAAAARYVASLATLHASLPSDVDVAVFLAEALLLTMCRSDGYHFYRPDGTPRSDATRAGELLLGAMAAERGGSLHPFAPHLYIHLTEPSAPSNATAPSFNASSAKGAARGLPSAELLASRLASTDSQHLLHMPAHVYLRVGRYRDAWYQNEKVAHRADAAYLAHGQIPYAPAHDAAFGLYGACMAGMRSAALTSSETLRSIYLAHPDRPDGPGPEMGWSLQHTTRLRFGDFAGVVSSDRTTPRHWPYAEALRHYANGSALVQLGRHDDANDAYNQLNTAAANASASFAPLLRVARLSLLASLQAAPATPAGLLSAVQSLRAAVDEQTSWVYDEPPKFHMPMRQCLGRLLLRADAPEQAYDVYTADLRQFPANGYSLWGLHQSMVLQPTKFTKAEVEKVSAQMAAAWSAADGPLTTSCAAFDPPNVKQQREVVVASTDCHSFPCTGADPSAPPIWCCANQTCQGSHTWEPTCYP